jgi:hypothetical protein
VRPARLVTPLLATALTLGLLAPALVIAQRTGSPPAVRPAPAPARPPAPATTQPRTTPTPAGGFGAPVLAPAGIPAVGRDPCVQLAACYRDLSRALCAPRAATCRRAFAAPAAALASEDCRARLADAGLTAAPWSGPTFVVPDACVD